MWNLYLYFISNKCDFHPNLKRLCFRFFLHCPTITYILIHTQNSHIHILSLSFNCYHFGNSQHPCRGIHPSWVNWGSEKQATGGHRPVSGRAKSQPQFHSRAGNKHWLQIHPGLPRVSHNPGIYEVPPRPALSQALGLEPSPPYGPLCSKELQDESIWHPI